MRQVLVKFYWNLLTLRLFLFSDTKSLSFLKKYFHCIFIAWSVMCRSRRELPSLLLRIRLRYNPIPAIQLWSGGADFPIIKTEPIYEKMKRMSASDSSPTRGAQRRWLRSCRAALAKREAPRGQKRTVQASTPKPAWSRSSELLLLTAQAVQMRTLAALRVTRPPPKKKSGTAVQRAAQIPREAN